ncbi:2-phospho-L-lactate guanylyltransferase [Methanobrevibacter curvatus]|uniref:2-phospho-L-lactate guanylyltransferase n=1 Tax=Methanobrevibacter curvatus TaxID=49547 RepID=A0A166C1I7_9EURY|nr:2-phospho-L-lactate guanylyltransferase [Methanobrevibacter curvatus]KZX14033.1 2-phospho-L-lactate guanylyltransferase [Methanobrevibacter curvatus]
MEELYVIIPVSKFKDAKTRLSPFLSQNERENLLKSMLKDVVGYLKNFIENILIVSNDEDVLIYAKELGAVPLKENENSDLNLGLKQSMEFLMDKCKKVLIIPSDIPLISHSNIKNIIDSSKSHDFIISPSRGGGTNSLIIKPLAIEMVFGDYSFFKHYKNAVKNDLNPIIYDSFFLSLDVNTIEDLGEILLHGKGTNTEKYLKSLDIKVDSIHGAERLKVFR